MLVLLRSSRSLTLSLPFRTLRSTISLRMPSDTNATGLSPAESKALPERQPEQNETRILQALRELYTCKPTESTYSVYAKDAVFHDPIGIANGVDAIKAQFNGLVKLFPRADLPKFRILKTPSSVPSNTIVIDQDVEYYRDTNAGKPTKTVNSLLTVFLTPTGDAIQKHMEEWDHKKEKTSDDGFFGLISEWRKKATANITDAFVSKEPPTKI